MIETGRVHQKARTRDSLIRATRQLLAAGDTPTVEQVAAAASISRATAYRYFPNQRALLVASYPEIADSSLLGPDPPADAAARLEIVAEAIARQAVEHESELRAMLRLSLEPDIPVGKSPVPCRAPHRLGRRRAHAAAWAASRSGIGQARPRRRLGGGHRCTRLADRHRGTLEASGGRAHALVGAQLVASRAGRPRRLTLRFTTRRNGGCRPTPPERRRAVSRRTSTGGPQGPRPSTDARRTRNRWAP